MIRRVGFVWIPIALLLLTSCAKDTGTGGSDGGSGLEGVTWILDTSSSADLGEVSDEARATVRFEDNEVGGTAFCNHFGGTYEAGADGSLRIEIGAMTEMACIEPLASLEIAYIEALAGVTAYEVTGDALTLIRDAGPALTYAAERSLPLVGTAWRLDGMMSGADAVSSTIAGTEVTATFADDGTLSGRGGCNRYETGYSMDGDALTIADGIMATKMACEPDVLDQESAYFVALAGAASFEIQGSTLTLLDEEGGFLLSFVGG